MGLKGRERPLGSHMFVMFCLGETREAWQHAFNDLLGLRMEILLSAV